MVPLRLNIEYKMLRMRPGIFRCLKWPQTTKSILVTLVDENMVVRKMQLNKGTL
jgi:hypothetical protein